MSKSPRRAVELAQEQANRGEGREWVPIYREMTLSSGGRIIHREAY
jgi:hypothetical protein